MIQFDNSVLFENCEYCFVCYFVAHEQLLEPTLVGTWNGLLTIIILSVLFYYNDTFLFLCTHMRRKRGQGGSDPCLFVSLPWYN